MKRFPTEHHDTNHLETKLQVANIREPKNPQTSLKTVLLKNIIVTEHLFSNETFSFDNLTSFSIKALYLDLMNGDAVFFKQTIRLLCRLRPGYV